jgi:polyribonucleotide nucleotidyltransferase
MNRTSETALGRDRLIVRTGHLAKQASGAVTVQFGETIVLVTVCAAKKPKAGQDFFPLTVEYQEKTYAGGMIPGGFFKREGRSTEKEILTSRLIDRPIRPLFPEGYMNEVQIIAAVLSSDQEHDPDVLGITGASLALLLSDVPFLEPVGAVRVGDVDGQFVINPNYEELKRSKLDLVVAGTADGITMIESGAAEVSEERMIQALEFAHEAVKRLVKFQLDFVRGIQKPKQAVEPPARHEELLRGIEAIARPAFGAINQPKKKEEREEAIEKLAEELVAKFVKEGGDVTEPQVRAILHDIEYEEVRKFILEKHLRVDGRKLDEIRPISCEVGLLPRTHGSALFTRGQTQSLGITTLGTSDDEQIIESYQGTLTRHFMLHYNFPPFSVGEIKPVRGPGRREIGHGALAWRGIQPVLPSRDTFPYTIRVVSDILESNGSSSMATVCSSSLSLMDAGVPIRAQVSGIAMGLVIEGDRWAVLSDIAGVEDHLGDMDFKVAGTREGITTLQLDIKLKEGLRFDILRKALQQANAGRLFILDKMNAVLDRPRPSTSVYAPRITTVKIHPDKIREIIGPGGKMIRKIQQDSGATIEVEDDGTVRVASNKEDAARKAIEMIHEIAAEPEIGKTYRATVKRLMNFGAFCEFMPGREGLVHVSELSNHYTQNVEDEVKVGDQFDVKVIEIDTQGRVNLSRRQALPDYDPSKDQRAQGPRGDFGRGPRPEHGHRREHGHRPEHAPRHRDGNHKDSHHKRGGH